jgi:hypothetical protein
MSVTLAVVAVVNAAGLQKCKAQESELAVLWTIGIFALNFGPVLVGPVLDKIKPRWTSVIGKLSFCFLCFGRLRDTRCNRTWETCVHSNTSLAAFYCRSALCFIVFKSPTAMHHTLISSLK